MNDFLKTLLILGLIIIGFLFWQSSKVPDIDVDYSVQVDDANTSDRCAEFRRPANGDGEVWTLSYGDRIRQFFSGCF